MTNPGRVSSEAEGLSALEKHEYGMLAQINPNGDIRISFKHFVHFVQIVVPGHHVPEMLGAWQAAVDLGDEFVGCVLYHCEAAGEASLARIDAEASSFLLTFKGLVVNWPFPTHALAGIQATLVQTYEAHIAEQGGPDLAKTVGNA